MTTRKIVPRGDDEGGIGTALKRWANAFIKALTANSITVSDLAASLPVFTDANKKLATIALPKFSAHKNNVDQTGIVTITWTKVTFPTEVYDVGGTYDAPNSKWIPGIIGKAHISVAFYLITAVDQTEMYIAIYKNGYNYKAFFIPASGTGAQNLMIGCDMLIDAITDYFEIYVYQKSGVNKDIGGDVTYTWFMGHMLP